MRGGRATLLLAALALAAARCGADEGPAAGSGLTVQLAVRDAGGDEAQRFDAGTPIHLAIEVRNQGGASASLHFSSGRTHDALILAEDGAPVWRWSDGRSFTQALTEIELGPGEARRFGLVCDAQPGAGPALAPGRYRAVAVIPTLGAELRSAPVPLQVR